MELENRVHDAIAKWKRHDEMNLALLKDMDILNNPKLAQQDVSRSPEFAKIRLKSLDQLTSSLVYGSNHQERASLKVIAITRKQLLNTAYPGIKGAIMRLFFRSFHLLREKKIDIQVQQKQKLDLFNLTASLTDAGLKNITDKVLERIKQGERNFSLPVVLNRPHNEELTFIAKICFDATRGHYLHGYEAYIQMDGNSGNIRQQSFHTDHGPLPDVNKAANLMAGRTALHPILEHGELVPYWQKISFERGMNDSSGSYPIKKLPFETFNLIDQCTSLPLWQHIDVMTRLKTTTGLMLGNRQEVVIQTPKKQFQYFLEVDPGNRRLLAFDKNGKVIDPKSILAERPEKKNISQQQVQGPATKVEPQTPQPHRELTPRQTSSRNQTISSKHKKAKGFRPNKKSRKFKRR